MPDLLSLEFLPLLMAGFGFGLLHALDADHVMAVSVLSNERPSFWRTLRYSASWALGHGAILITAGLLLFSAGWALPESLQHFAELMVGVLLIVLGIWCFYRFRKESVQLKQHRHGDIVHTHLHVDGHDKDGTHKPVLVGMLHGLAGSAPALALVPVVTNMQVLSAFFYLSVFSVGVMLGMILFGFGFGGLQQFLQRRYEALYHASRYLVASISILFGSYWVWQAI